MEKVIRNGKVAVLYSPSFGAGWYTWNTSHPEMIFHPKVVELVEQNRHKEIPNFIRELFDENEFYTGGAMDLEIAWLDEGTQFEIHEYDGSESIKTIDSLTLEA